MKHPVMVYLFLFLLVPAWAIAGDIVFTDSGQLMGNSSSVCVQLGDLDGDGDPDAFVANNSPNTVWINDSATSVEQQVTQQLLEANSLITELPETAFSNPNHQRTLPKKIDEVINKVAAGELRDARNKLKNDVLKKMDGTAKKGTPDKNDWIIDSEAQNQVYPPAKKALDLLSQ